MRDFFLLLVRILWRLGVSLVVLVLVLVTLKLLHGAYASHFGFDRVQWAASAAALRTDPEAGYDNPREGMVDDVVAHELRLGMSRAEVLALLGAADSTDDFEWHYEAGWRTIDPSILVITFSKHGTVLHYQLVE